MRFGGEPGKARVNGGLEKPHTPRSIVWRADVDKIGYEHRNPIHPELQLVLDRDRAIAELTGELKDLGGWKTGRR